KKEIRAVSSCFPGRVLETVYFGGGTPTSISAGQLRELIRCVKESFDMSGVREFTVEAGRPDSITEDKLLMLKDEGITRISINPQSMVERTLETIGRRHTAQQVRDAFAMARKLGFNNINMDLIAGLTGEDINDFNFTLSEIEKLDPDSVTVHTLARKRAARLTTEGELYEGNEAKDVALMVETAASFMKEHGYEPYYLYRQKNMTDNLENVGYARPGKEGLYNILIMEEKQIILACGSGASSKFVRDAGDKRFERVENVKNVHEYIDRIDEMISRKLDYIAEHGIE
ncbi:MAG: coproporphyrinogen dehydrogenase HemZ, partial [Lachnospiraceae bacterium]|nr:coproporphyrinogen dehydrogenase HemZ [Lachnospiraceae bacterium]